MEWKYINSLASSTLVYVTFPKSGHETSITRTGPPLKSLFPIMQMNTQVEWSWITKNSVWTGPDTKPWFYFINFKHYSQVIGFYNRRHRNTGQIKHIFQIECNRQAKDIWFDAIIRVCLNGLITLISGIFPVKWLTVKPCLNKQSNNQYRIYCRLQLRPT